MENKTPMQELIVYIELNQPKNKVTDGIWAKAKSLLPKEKQVIMDAHEDGADWQGTIEAEDYYNQNFRKDE